jgi:hypothetical protein
VDVIRGRFPQLLTSLKVTPWRLLGIYSSCSFFVDCGRRGGAADVAAFERSLSALRADDVGVVDEPVDHHGGHDLVVEHLPLRPNALLLVRISEARS